MEFVKYFKLDEDDVLEIVGEKIAESTGIQEFFCKSIFFGVPGKDLRAVIAVSDAELKNVDLKKVDDTLEFNGDHSYVNWLNNEQIDIAIENMLRKKKF